MVRIHYLSRAYDIGAGIMLALCITHANRTRKRGVRVSKE